MMATDPAGRLVARTDRPSETGDELSRPTRSSERALEGEDSATLWRQGDQLFTAVAVPMQTGPELVGVLVAGYGINEAVASQIHKLTHSEIAFLVQASGSARAARGLVARPARAGPRGRAVAGRRWPARRRAVRGRARRASATSASASRSQSAAGEEIGAVLALRSLSAETAVVPPVPQQPDRCVSLGVMALGLVAAWVAASRITGPRAQAGGARRAHPRRLLLGRGGRPRAGTRSACWRAPSTAFSPTCARRTR